MIARIRSRLRSPFSDIAGEMFARNWCDPHVVIALDTPDGPHRIVFEDFRTARKAYEGKP